MYTRHSARLLTRHNGSSRGINNNVLLKVLSTKSSTLTSQSTLVIQSCIRQEECITIFRCVTTTSWHWSMRKTPVWCHLERCLLGPMRRQVNATLSHKTHNIIFLPHNLELYWLLGHNIWLRPKHTILNSVLYFPLTKWGSSQWWSIQTIVTINAYYINIQIFLTLARTKS